MKILYESEMVDMEAFSFDKDIVRDLQIDSLNRVAILVAIESEFVTLFEDSVFETARNFGELVNILQRNRYLF